MSNSRIHIDQLFVKGLENLEIPISSNSFENIRKNIVSDNSESFSENKSFDNFALEVTDADWQIIKERLAKAIAADPLNKVTSSLQELELAITENDWNAVKNKLAAKTSQTIIPLPFNYIQDSFKDFEIAVTDTDWNATKSKLEHFTKKKMVWWWWLNIAILGTLIGLGLNYYAPLNQASAAISNPTNTQIDVSVPNKAGNADLTNQPGYRSEKPDPNIGGSETELPVQLNSANPAISIRKNTSPYRAIAQSSKGAHSESIVNNSKEINPNISLEKNLLNDEIEKPASDKNAGYALSVNESINSNSPQIEGPTLSSSSNIQSNESKTSVNNVDEVSTSKKEESTLTKINPVDTPKKDNPVKSVPAVPIPKPILNFTIGLTTDIAMTGRHLSNDNRASYNTIRNNAEKPVAQFSYGITTGFQKGFNQFQTGFQLTEQNFTSNYNYTLKYQDSIPVIRGGVLIGKFPIGPFKEKNINESTNITIKKVDIPFTYNRFWRLGVKSQLITGVSGVISINSKMEGTKMLNPVNNQLYNYTALKGAEQKIGFSPALNLGIQRNLTRNFAVQGSIFGKYSVTNRYDTKFSMKEYPYSTDTKSFEAKEYLYSYGLSIKLLYLLK